MPTGRGEAKDKKAKKKSKDQLEKELKRKTVSAPIQPMTVELVPRKQRPGPDVVDVEHVLHAEPAIARDDLVPGLPRRGQRNTSAR